MMSEECGDSVYSVPGFNVAGIKSDAWTETAQPSAGIVFHF
jgi:hypothetical protein